MEIFTRYLRNEVSQADCIHAVRQLTETLGAEYNWWSDVVQHRYTTRGAEKIFRYILRPAREVGILK